jgi:hypothetical protein
VEASFVKVPERGGKAFKEKTNKKNLNGTFFASKIKKKNSSFQICAKKNVGAYLCPSPLLKVVSMCLLQGRI